MVDNLVNHPWLPSSSTAARCPKWSRNESKWNSLKQGVDTAMRQERLMEFGKETHEKRGKTNNNIFSKTGLHE
ncbi:hypothetical protein L596_030148 [Steinernema carpocapsae]|uniref:Uncharacterized protein n=1 Tax=Steinernema carpocapsae TaxID=34508 RepID=A0A4U5LRV1_STECR|nr:hypothetical protein L596_030148 [Steinernema carpocapsae]